MAFKCVCGNPEILIDTKNNQGKCSGCGAFFTNDDDGKILISKPVGNTYSSPEKYLSIDENNKLVCN